MRHAILVLCACLLAACTAGQREGIWASIRHGENEARAPFEMAPGLYYVGAKNVAVYAIQTSEGLIVIDGGYPSMAPRILENLRTLGLDPADVRILLNTHAHFDHSGGLAALKQATGARILASPADAALIESGGRGDFYLGDWMTFPGAEVDHELSDGEQVTLGDVTLTAHITPGHTKGCTSWTFPVVIDGQTQQVLLICSVSILHYDLTDNAKYPEIAADFERSFAALYALQCDVPLGAHGDNYDLEGKRARQEAGGGSAVYIDPEGCRVHLEAGEREFRDALAEQQR